VFSAITLDPLNTLVERCVDEFANMSCISNQEDEITWTYDGNTVINSPCLANTPLVFMAKPVVNPDGEQCDIAGSLANARAERFIRSISGPYGCTDRHSSGITSTSMVVVLGTSTIFFALWFLILSIFCFFLFLA